MSPGVATWEHQQSHAVKKSPTAIGPGEDDLYFAYIPWRNIEVITRIRTRYTVPFEVRGRIRNYRVPIEAYLATNRNFRKRFW